MSDLPHNQPRALAPRKLDHQETLQTLNQWKNVFKNYYRRCQFYGTFLQPGASWTNGPNRGFTETETSGLKRSPTILASDLESFLECLASYLPFDYIADKLNAESSNMRTVWAIIYEVYDAEISTTHYLDYASMTKLPQETYRNYFNRLVGFVRQHLPDKHIEAEGVSSPNAGEQLTIGLLDSITIHWLLSIDRRLINIVKIEFAADLKVKRLCQMVKQIAANIDELLQRYGQNDTINAVVNIPSSPHQQAITGSPKIQQTSDVDMIVRRLERLERRGYPNKTRKAKYTRNDNKTFGTCPHCLILNKQLGANLNVKHSANACTRKKFSVSLIESIDDHEEGIASQEGDTDTDEGGKCCLINSSSHSLLQITNESTARSFPVEDSFNNFPRHSDKIQQPEINGLSMTNDDFSDKLSIQNKADDEFIQNFLPSDNLDKFRAGTTQLDNSHSDAVIFLASLNKLSSSNFGWAAILKSKSPRLKCTLNNFSFIAVVDSGAEINVIDITVARNAGVGIVKTSEIATAANQLPLDIHGRTSSPISLLCKTNEGSKMIYLGYVLVVNNLGIGCLIGEPGKAHNNIICLPRKKNIVLAGGDDIHNVPYYSETPGYTLARAVKSVILQPNEQIRYKLPDKLSTCSHVLITPRRNSVQWLTPGISEVVEGHVFLTNSALNEINIKKTEHMADIRETREFIANNGHEAPFQAVHHPDKFQFEDLSQSKNNENFLDQLSVDPDNILNPTEKKLFHDLHLKYRQLFRPEPGKYNGAYGYVDNKLKFSTPPAPNARTHVPNYSPSMNQILAKKMDLLETWGVLATPEQVGVAVEFVSPSMLVPKPDSDDYRLVTDFAALNVYLKRIPNTSATIAQAKARIARAKFVVHLDFSQYFYQNGLQKQDIKYLGTVHPFKGLKVYTCDPQGLKGASERSYEKLLRIYGDMIQAGKLAQMADGLHVLGDSVPQLAQNYEEVLNRANLCNLTFKPTKVVVCPENISLFGWDLKGQQWYPTAHTVSALTNAPTPSTVKQLRSFLGSFKQLSASLPNYALTIKALEQIVAGKKSAEKIVWTDHLQESFEAAKRLAANPVGIAEPRPDDQLQTFSDYSAHTRAVGGRLIILRKQPNGETKELVGGFFSAILDKHKKNWIPCEGEAAAIRLVLEHFKHHIRESENNTIHYTDSQPCVLAWRRSLKGAFSASSRISTFLTGLSVLPIELRHRPGKLMFTSDFASRHPTECKSPKCQVCSFVRQWEGVGDRASNIRSVTVDDIKSGRTIMPMIQKNTWKSVFF